MENRYIKLLGPIVLLVLVIVLAVVILSVHFLSSGIPVSSDGGDDGEIIISYVPDTKDYPSAEATFLLSEGYVVYGGDYFCIHVWQDWIMLTPSTITSKGNELRYCEECGAHQSREFGELHGIGERALLDVKCLYQMPDYPNGCEVVSLTIVLKYLGYNVSTDELIDGHLPRGVYGRPGDNPFYEYLGNPRDLGVGCYAPCIVETANSYLESEGEAPSAVDISGKGFDTYKLYVSEGIPVIFWGTTYMDCDPEVFGVIEADGEEIIWRNHSHCFVMIGYTDTTYIFCDPLRGIIEYPKEDVEESHGLVYKQACIVK